MLGFHGGAVHGITLVGLDIFNLLPTLFPAVCLNVKHKLKGCRWEENLDYSDQQCSLLMKACL